MTTFTLELTYTREDLKALSAYGGRWWHHLPLPAGCWLATLPGAAVSAWMGEVALACVVMGLAFVAGAVAAPFLTRPNEADLGKSQTLTVAPDHFESVSGEGRGRWQWSCLREVVEVGDRLVMPMGPMCWVIPDTAFASLAERTEFLRFVRERIAAAEPFERASAAAMSEAAPAGPHSANLSVEAVFQNCTSDLLAAQNRASFRGKSPLVPLGALAAFVLMGVVVQTLEGLNWATFSAGWALSFVGGWVLVMNLMATALNAYTWRRSASWLGLPRRVQLTPMAISATTQLFTSELNWEAVHAVEHDARRLYLFRRLAGADAIVVPAAAFPSALDFERFVEYAQRCLAEGQARKTAGQPAAS